VPEAPADGTLRVQMPTHLEQMSRVYGEETWSVYDLLDRSLEPRGHDSLHDLAAECLAPGAVILDAGCRDATDLIRLVQAHDATGVGVDPVEIHVARARAAVAAAELDGRIELVQGVMETLPYPNGHFDFVWCRDVVEQLDLLVPALKGAARVLKPDGHMVVYTVFVTDLLAPQEFELLERHLANVSSNLVERNVEEAFADAGLAIERKDVIGTEYKEYAEERTQAASRTLLRLARLRRLRSSVIESHGEDIYHHVQANLHWEVFQFLGKLQPTVYVLRHR
jgi:ubiquinone/menaquinone biosynthesis C-methylase UbiE